MGPGGIHQAMLAPEWIVVRARRSESAGSIALTDCMEVNSMCAGREIVKLQPHVNDHVRILKELGRPASIAVGGSECGVRDGNLVVAARHVGAARDNGCGERNDETA